MPALTEAHARAPEYGDLVSRGVVGTSACTHGLQHRAREFRALANFAVFVDGRGSALPTSGPVEVS